MTTLVVFDAQRWANALPEMPQYEVRVFLALCLMAEGSPRFTFRNEDLIGQSGVCKSLVQRGIWALAKRQMMVLVERIGGHANRTTVILSPKWVTFREGK